MLNKPLRPSSVLLRVAAVALALLGVLTVAGSSTLHAASLVGTVQGTFGGFGTATGRLNFPYGVAFDAFNRRVIVADTFNNRIQAFQPDGTPANVFGGTNVIAGFEWPIGVSVDPSGHIFVANEGHHR